MKVTTEEIPERQLVLNIEAEPQELEQFMSLAYRHLVQRTAVPGFRKGKAPRSMLERYLGRGAFMEEALNHLLPEMTNKAIQEQTIDIVAEPKIELTTLEPITFKATLSLKPTVNLGAYRELRVKEEPVEVTEEQINNALEELRINNAPWEPIDRPVQLGDLLTLDAEATQGETKIMDDKGASYIPQAGLTMPLPGFSEQLVGMRKGETKEFTLSFPQDDTRPELAGKEFHLKATVSEIKGKKLPNLDDEFAKTVGQEFENLEQLKERVRTNLKTIAQATNTRNYREQVLAQVVKGATVVYPPVLVDHEIDHLLTDSVQNYTANGKLDDYLKRVGKTEEQIREEFKSEAVERVTRSLVIGQVIQEESITVTDAEVDEEIDRIAKDTQGRESQMRELLSVPQNRDSMRRTLLSRKCIERLAEIARGNGSRAESRASETGEGAQEGVPPEMKTEKA